MPLVLREGHLRGPQAALIKSGKPGIVEKITGCNPKADKWNIEHGQGTRDTIPAANLREDVTPSTLRPIRL
jgi:hypothetical protein